MKNTITLTILLTIMLISTADAQLPFVVQTVYFKPTDAPPAPKTLSQTMRDVQLLYLEEMERNGYGAKTFRLETDAKGNTIIHTINGRHATAHYQATTYDVYQGGTAQQVLESE